MDNQMGQFCKCEVAHRAPNSQRTQTNSRKQLIVSQVQFKLKHPLVNFLVSSKSFSSWKSSQQIF
ncbi:hypothetical protein AAZX31_14G154600 [Glycine max]